MKIQILAFTLIECAVYMALFSFFAVLVGGFCSSLYMVHQQHCQRIAGRQANDLVLDMFWRDLLSASDNVAEWNMEHGIFTKRFCDESHNQIETCVGWEVFCNNDGHYAARRSEGIYNFKLAQWTSRSVSICGCSLQSLQLTYEMLRDKKHIERVVVHYVDQCGANDCLIKLRARRVV